MILVAAVGDDREAAAQIAVDATGKVSHHGSYWFWTFVVSAAGARGFCGGTAALAFLGEVAGVGDARLWEVATNGVGGEAWPRNEKSLIDCVAPCFDAWVACGSVVKGHEGRDRIFAGVVTHISWERYGPEPVRSACTLKDCVVV